MACSKACCTSGALGLGVRVPRKPCDSTRSEYPNEMPAHGFAGSAIAVEPRLGKNAQVSRTSGIFKKIPLFMKFNGSWNR